MTQQPRVRVMTRKSNDEQRPPLHQGVQQQQQKRPRPLKGFVIAGASLAVLFSIAYIKGRA